MEKYYLAVDMGASSGRAILGSVKDGRIELEEVHRFENHLIERAGYLTWDIDGLWEGVLTGLRKCGEMGRIPESMGIDTWGVDYVLLDEAGEMLGNAISYRDSRTDGMDRLVEKIISDQELYEKTGLQKLLFNSIYQLMQTKEKMPELLEKAEHLLMIPDYLNYRLTGVMCQEYTDASTTGLVNARSCEWDQELIRRLSLPERLFGKLSMPGTVVGCLTEEIQKAVGFNTKVVLPASHDTGSAFLSVPSDEEDTLILSSGTWSLMGVENKEAVTSEKSREANFTNEGGAWQRYRYLKNIMGLWMIQSVRRQLNGTEYVVSDGGKTLSYGWGFRDLQAAKAGEKKWGFGELSALAREAGDFSSKVDVNNDRFLRPASMIDEILGALKESGQKVPETVGELMQCIYVSLSDCYRETASLLTSINGKVYRELNIIGGGCQDAYLNEMTAKALGIPVIAGPIEGTAIGNLIVQMIADGVFENLSAARSSIGKSFEIRTFEP